MQPLDQKSGMINIRADDDQEPDEVLAGLSMEQRVRGAQRQRSSRSAGASQQPYTASDVHGLRCACCRRSHCCCRCLTHAPNAPPPPPPLIEQLQLEAMRNDEVLYDRLAASVAPNVHGHLDVKRAILLMLLGGMHKVTKEVSGGRCCALGGCLPARTAPPSALLLASCACESRRSFIT